VAGRVPYSAQERAEAIAICAKVGSNIAAERTGIAASTIRKWMQEERRNQAGAAKHEYRHDVGGDLGPGHVRPSYPDLRIPTMDMEEVFDLLEQHQAVVAKATPGQDEATVVIETTEPVVEVLTSDWHLGAPGTDYKRFRADLDYFCSAPFLYETVVGDEIDNFIAFKSQKAMLGQIIEPSLQDRLLELVYERLMKAGKIIGRTHGNHLQGFNERVYGGDDKWYVDAPYFPGTGKLWLKVGQETYAHYLNHKFRGHSMYNAVHGAMRAARFEWDPAEILCDGHTHDGLQYARFRDGDRIKYAIKLGTYKTRDTHGQRHYGSGGFYGVVAIVFWPDQHQFRLFEDVREAMLFRSALVGHSQAA
jgi:transposase-like protein